MKSKIDKIYDYRDANGEVVSQTVRFEPKTFRQRRPLNGHFAWGLNADWYEQRASGDYHYVNNATPNPQEPPHDKAIWLPDTKSVLYNLPEIVMGIHKGDTIYIVEGEKDADSICGLGYIGTTCARGADKWQASYTEALKGCQAAVIIADKDSRGRKHGKSVAAQLAATGINVKVIEMPDRNETKVKDFSDWRDAGVKSEDEQYGFPK